MKQVKMTGTQAACVESLIENGVDRKAADVTLVEHGYAPTAPSVWVVTVPSAYRLGHQCYLGRGLTKQAALEDAYGPRSQWGNNTRKSLRIASVYSTDPNTADELEHSAE